MANNPKKEDLTKMPPRIAGGSGAVAPNRNIPVPPPKTNLEKILTGETTVKELIRSTSFDEALKQRHRSHYRRDDELDPVLAFHLGRRYM